VEGKFKKLSRHGNRLALAIDPAVLASLGIDEHTPLEIFTDGEVLVVAPVRDEKRRKQFEQALADSNQRYGRTLRRLAE